MTESVWLGAGESQDADTTIANHQGETAKRLDACFQERPGKFGKTCIRLGVDRKRLLMLPHPAGD